MLPPAALLQLGEGLPFRMRSMAHSRGRATALALIAVAALGACAYRAVRTGTEPPVQWRLIHRDDFRGGLERWTVEAERGGRFAAERGVFDIDAPGGATIWFKPELHAPAMIEYRVRAISAGGPNDRVSDLNTFWMANDARAPGQILRVTRGGAFAEYDWLTGYYVGMGGNSNTTTRFRRYVGRQGDRPLLPENDRRSADVLLTPNREMTIRIVTLAGRVQYFRDGVLIFSFDDPEPYVRGWFALRTTQNHMQVRDFRVYSAAPD
jgi:hypothetical protein